MNRDPVREAWARLAAELALWAPGRASFWWRDDDAVAPTAALERLLALGPQPLALAVIPANLDPALPACLAGRWVDVLQHGYAHRNHEPPEHKKAELGQARPAGTVLEELRAGWQRLAAAFGDRALPVLVPPWNRITTRLIRRLPDWGYQGLSTYGPRQPVPLAPGGSGRLDVLQANTHVDIIDWQSRRFRGVPAVLDCVLDHLRARREGRVDAAEPTGLLTHHLAMDDAAFDFTAEFLERTVRHPAVHWRSAGDIFGQGTGLASV
ncbi:MAG TPA: polysaccharide deacetylase family protein [Dongiaceae bacterium]|jgi:hypothetical protein|nr:polysaccharide deacetylase family protein [Dongiaceae bacterium]